MNKFFRSITCIVASAAMLCLLPSCGGDGKITFPTDASVVLGDDAAYIGVAPASKAEVTVDYSDDGAFKSQKFRLTVKLRLNKKLDISDIVKVEMPEICRLEVLDQEGYALQNEFTLGAKQQDVAMKEKLQAFLLKDEGAEEDFVFYMEIGNEEVAKELEAKIKKAKGVQLSHFKILCNGLPINRLGKAVTASGLAATDIQLGYGLEGNVEALDGAKVTIGEDGHPQVAITLKKVRNFNVNDFTNAYDQIWMAAYAVDANGYELTQFQNPYYTEWRNSEDNRVKAFLQGKVGETATFVFVAGANTPKAQEALNFVNGFRLKTTIEQY
jgi:hypothetical protein